MSLKHIARYKAIQNGSSIEEELRLLRIKSQINYENMFLVKLDTDKFGRKINNKNGGQNK